MFSVTCGKIMGNCRISNIYEPKVYCNYSLYMSLYSTRPHPGTPFLRQASGHIFKDDLGYLLHAK